MSVQSAQPISWLCDFDLSKFYTENHTDGRQSAARSSGWT